MSDRRPFFDFFINPMGDGGKLPRLAAQPNTSESAGQSSVVEQLKASFKYSSGKKDADVPEALRSRAVAVERKLGRNFTTRRDLLYDCIEWSSEPTFQRLECHAVMKLPPHHSHHIIQTVIHPSIRLTIHSTSPGPTQVPWRRAAQVCNLARVAAALALFLAEAAHRPTQRAGVEPAPRWSARKAIGVRRAHAPKEWP